MSAADVACYVAKDMGRNRLHVYQEGDIEQARRHSEVFKKLRRFLSEDYYLRTPQPRPLAAWSGWQFHDPKADEGFVQSFRIRSPEPARRLVLQALDPNSRYRVAT